MGAGGTDEDDRLPRFESADSMENFQLEQRPALARLLDDFLQCLFRHAGRMLEKHPGDILAIIEIANVADKAGYRADAEIGRVQRVESPRR